MMTISRRKQSSKIRTARFCSSVWRGYDVTSCLVPCSFLGSASRGGSALPPSFPWTDKHLWKHCLPATLLAVSKYLQTVCLKQWKFMILAVDNSEKPVKYFFILMLHLTEGHWPYTCVEQSGTHIEILHHNAGRILNVDLETDVWSKVRVLWCFSLRS